MLEISLFVLLLVAAVNGAYHVRTWVTQHNPGVRGLGVGALALLAVAALVPGGPAAAQSTLEVDLTPFFESLNNYLPLFIGIFAIIGGIAGAIALSRFLINAIVNAFKGGAL